MKEAGQKSMMYEEKCAMSVCLHYPRRGVNKYMRKREIDARLGEIGWRRGKNEPRLCTWPCRLVHKLPKIVEEKERMEIGMRRFWKVHQQPVVIVIVINSRYSHLQES